MNFFEFVLELFYFAVVLFVQLGWFGLVNCFVVSVYFGFVMIMRGWLVRFVYCFAFAL